MAYQPLEIGGVRERLNDIKARFDLPLTGADKMFIERAYRRVFGHDVPNKKSGCSNCYRDAFIVLFNQVKNMAKLPKPSDYALKNGVVYQVPFSGKAYVGDVPNEVAEGILAKFPNKISMFARYPEDWEKRVKKSAKKAAKNDKTDKVDEQTEQKVEQPTDGEPTGGEPTDQADPTDQTDGGGTEQQPEGE